MEIRNVEESFVPGFNVIILLVNIVTS